MQGQAVDLIDSLRVDGGTIRVSFDRDFARQYLREDFFVEYEDVGRVAELDPSLLSIPALLNVLPIVWLTGGRFEVESMDAALHDSLPEVRAGFQRMFPRLRWTGEVRARRLVSNPRPAGDEGRVALFFSGGVDPTYSSLQQRGADQLLFTIWGTDIALDNPEGWKHARAQVESFAEVHGHRAVFARSNLRGFLNESHLNGLVPGIPNWWLHAQHGVGLVGVAAPVTSALGYPLVVFSAGRMISQRSTLGASPDLEGRLRWAGSRAIHFGDDVVRHEKLRAVVEFFRDSPLPPPSLRVCFLYPYGSGNCGRCEKCLRTMTGLVVEGASPPAYGFDVPAAEALRRARRRFRIRGMVFGEGPHWFWREIQERARERLAAGGPPPVDGVDVRPFFSWLAAFDLARYRRQWGVIGRARAASIRLVRRWPRLARLVMRGMASARAK